jgi:hypothetical protein
VELTTSYKSIFPNEVLARYQFAETRNAAAIIKTTNPQAFEDLTSVLGEFKLLTKDFLTPGGQETELAARLNTSFRTRGWREARVDTLMRLSLVMTPLKSEGEKKLEPLITETENRGYKVDNFRDRVALDVEWNAKDGNLDRDIGAYRALYDNALIDAGVMITRTLHDLRTLANKVGLEAGFDPERAKKILQGTTTTNSEKLIPKLTRGDAGGCPVFAVFISADTYVP